MNPLCVTWAPLRHTEIGRRNLDSFIASGFDHVLGTPNGKVTRQLTSLAFKHLGGSFSTFYLWPNQLPHAYGCEV